MPVIHDPELGAEYTYSTRRDSLVRIRRLSLPPLQIPVELRFPRWLLTRSSSWTWLAQACAVALIYAVHAPPPTHKRTLVLPLWSDIWSDVRARLRINRTDLYYVRHFLDAPPPEGFSHEGFLRARFNVYLLNPKVLSQIACPARGPKAAAWRLPPVVTAALVFSRYLVERAENEPRLKAKITRVIAEDCACLNYLGITEVPSANQVGVEYVRAGGDAPEGSARYFHQQLVSIALADRTLRGAWEKHKTRPLMAYPLPEDVFRQYLYGRLGDRVTAARKAAPPDMRSKADDRWFDRLLGAPGQAARDFHLL